MSEIKPVSIKTELQRISDKFSEKTITYLADHVFLKESRAEAAELRAALEAQQAENADLKHQAAKDHVKILSLKDALSAYGDPDVFADDED